MTSSWVQYRGEYPPLPAARSHPLAQGGADVGRVKGGGSGWVKYRECLRGCLLAGFAEHHIGHYSDHTVRNLRIVTRALHTLTFSNQGNDKSHPENESTNDFTIN
ncbi:hypothetical protein AALO_G00154700 [Alosa alosa]|uniref:Uncharacterized protein n=1 Tax=Alosa alosa TaxID=278164 RepID=A0AAV6GFN4_9TELE|nr:hypothetical protein AALO_G00154700 [Alosa alosa]